MGLEIYETVVEIIGELPPELSFVYGIATILMFIVVILCVLTPFIILFNLMNLKWELLYIL